MLTIAETIRLLIIFNDIVVVKSLRYQINKTIDSSLDLSISQHPFSYSRSRDIHGSAYELGPP